MSSSTDKSHDNDNEKQLEKNDECSVDENVDENLPENQRTDNSKKNNRVSFTSRYGRTIKLVHQPNDNDSAKTAKMPKHSKSAESKLSTAESVTSNSSENGAVEDMIELANGKNQNIPAMNSNNSIKDIVKESVTCQWKVGEVGWAQVSAFPYWPCIVTLDPDTNKYFKSQIIGRARLVMVHVRYFGDNGRHNWVRELSMMPFTSLDDYKKMYVDWHNQSDMVKKRDAKRTAGFSVKAWSNVKWTTAVKEAVELLPLTINERLKQINLERKRPRRSNSMESSTIVTKKTKLDNGIKNGKKSDLDEDTKSIISLDGEIPPTPPSSHKDSSDESVISRKMRIRRIREPNKEKIAINPVPSFDLYYQRRKEAVANVSPDSTEDDIKIYLKKSWENMSEQARRKYIPRINRQSKQNSTINNPKSSVELPIKRGRGRPHKIKKEIELLPTIIDTGKKTRAPNLFRGTKSERVCQICETTGNLTRCKGPCYSYFHLACVRPGESESECDADDDIKHKATTETVLVDKTETMTIEDDDKKGDTVDETFKCIDCLSGVAPACFVCNDREEERIRCSVMACGKHYHPLCLKFWPQSHLQGGRLTCPYHMCHTCNSDNPQNGHVSAPNEKVVRCVRCPSTYHASTACLPAGSEILTGTQIICPKHYKPSHPPLNATWCFLCTRGGSLICCDTCPTSFHPECLGINAPDGAFICEDCETGRLPLYGEIVWVKLGNYRWWPSRICFPNEVPDNIEIVPHKFGEFCVMFLGTLNYYWVHRGRVFLYQDDDCNVKGSMNRSNVDGAFRQALIDANVLHQQLKRERKNEESRALKPPPYVKLKVNKPVGNVKPVEVESIVACECDARWENPCTTDADCLNRILSIECSPGICPAGSRCQNQSFVQRKYPKMEPFHTKGRGWGLRTLENIKSSQFVIEYVGEVIDEAEYKHRVSRKKELRNENYYFLTIDMFRTIDAEPKGNLSRFMNHSCQPNCETQKWTVNGDTRIGLFALRDIGKNEELTFNYNLASDGETRKPCLCGAPNCSGYIGLKVQKPQLTPLQSTKNGTQVKGKRHSRKTAKRFSCWKCGEILADDEDFVLCDLKTCYKRYHKKCVSFRKNHFSCPWHHCVECKKRTSAHCLFCTTASCQAHIDGILTEYKNEKGRYVCKVHEDREDVDSQKSSSPEEKEESDSRRSSDDDTEADRESLLADSDSPISEALPGETSPRVSIVEVQVSSEESEESQADDNPKEIRRGINKKKNSQQLVNNKSNNENIRILRSLTSSQLRKIIGSEL